MSAAVDVVSLLPIAMLVALVALLFSGFPVAFVLIGVGSSFAFLGIALSAFSPAQFAIFPLRIIGTVAENNIFAAVPMLVFMGVGLERSGIGQEMFACMRILLRRVPGGLLVSVVLVGLVFAPTTGMVGASVGLLTALALPIMLAERYDPALAAGTVAASGTIGIVMPPAVMLFFLADLFGANVAAIFLGALVPVGLLSVLFVAYVAARAVLDPVGVPRPKADGTTLSWSELAALSARSLVLPGLVLALLFASIIAGWATPVESSSVAAAATVLVMALNRSLSVAAVKDVILKTARITAMVFAIVVGATVFSFCFRLYGGDDLIVALLRDLGVGDLALLAAVMAVVFFLGFFLDWIEIVFVSLPIMMPVLGKLDLSAYVAQPGFATTWIAILLALNLQTSFLTPPFGFALFFVKGSAPSSLGMGEIYRGVLPFIAIELLVIGAVALFPALVTWLPARYVQL
ncbi:MAG: TRAP transporter large permease subunit [Alphaproteobacteria bacterium]|nr:TRAP transporter large permease subunit [Alphaproteobacteria bacterium]